MSKIKMLKTTTGSIDGIHIRKFEKGLVYDIPSQITIYLSNLFLKMNVAKIARERRIEPPAIQPTETQLVEPTETKDEFIETEEVQEVEETQKIKEENKPKMRVYQLADELNESSKDIIKLAADLGIHAPAPQSGLSEEEVNTIKKSLK